MYSVCSCVLLWVYSEQPVKRSLQDIGLSFVEEGKGAARSGWGGEENGKKYPSTEFREREDWSTVCKRCWVLWKWAPTPVDERRETGKRKKDVRQQEYRGCLQAFVLLREGTRCCVA